MLEPTPTGGNGSCPRWFLSRPPRGREAGARGTIECVGRYL
jgi:hypothetical protein